MSRPLQDVQDEILEDLHAGTPIDREALLLEHAEHASALRRFFALLDVVEASSTSATSPAASGRLGDFEILRELGRGGMGVVYEARQLSLNRKVALKVLPVSSRGDRRSLQRFRREAEAAARLRHPNLVPVYAIGESGGAPFFAMELVDGRSLADVISARARGELAGVPSDAEAFRAWCVRTVATVAEALGYAHGQGILHRDVKPANILLEADGTPRLTDFGLALDLEASGITLSGEVFGSPLYMSPEQAFRRSRPLDARTDVYSLAVTLHELLTGRLPFAGPTHGDVMAALSSGDLVPPRAIDHSMPQALEDVLLTALAHDPDRRYASASEFASDLRASLDGGRVSTATSRRLAGRGLLGRLRGRAAGHVRRAERGVGVGVPAHARRAQAVVQIVLVMIAIVVPLVFVGVAFVRAAESSAMAARSEAEAQRAHAEVQREEAARALALVQRARREGATPGDDAGGDRAPEDARTSDDGGDRAPGDARTLDDGASLVAQSGPGLDAAMRAALAPRRAVVVQVDDTAQGRELRVLLETERAGGPVAAACVIELRTAVGEPVLARARVFVPAVTDDAADDATAGATSDVGLHTVVVFSAARELTAPAWMKLTAVEHGTLPSLHLTYVASRDVALEAGASGGYWGGELHVEVPLGVGAQGEH